MSRQGTAEFHADHTILRYERRLNQLRSLRRRLGALR